MLRRPMPRLLSAAAVTGAACALSAAALAAAAAAPALAAAAVPRPAGHWSGPEGPLPRAFTNAAAALAPVSFPGSAGRGLLAAWKGQLSGRVFYETRLSAAGHWSARASIPLARTNRAPSVASYTDPDGRPAEVAVWKGRGNRRIWYSQGETARNGTISWTVPQSLPRTVRDRTRSAPAVFFPFDTYVAVVAWKGPLHHVRYAIGTPGLASRVPVVGVASHSGLAHQDRSRDRRSARRHGPRHLVRAVARAADAPDPLRDHAGSAHLGQRPDLDGAGRGAGRGDRRGPCRLVTRGAWRQPAAGGVQGAALRARAVPAGHGRRLEPAAPGPPGTDGGGARVAWRRPGDDKPVSQREHFLPRIRLTGDPSG